MARYGGQVLVEHDVTWDLFPADSPEASRSAFVVGFVALAAV